MEGNGMSADVCTEEESGLSCKNGSMARRRLVMGLGSGFAESASTLSGGSLTTGTTGIGGGSVSVTECFRLRKKEDVFFCSV
jgi:hypothetical protein